MPLASSSNRIFDAAYARGLFLYDPSTGILTWRVDRPPRVKSGQRVGTGKKRAIVKINQRAYYATSIIWLITTGEWPCSEIDHRDCDNTNDRWGNLRLANRTQQRGNSRVGKRNTSGFKGVSKRGSVWVAQIGFGQTTKYLGTFYNPQDAQAAYIKAALEKYGEFARSG